MEAVAWAAAEVRQSKCEPGGLYTLVTQIISPHASDLQPIKAFSMLTCGAASGFFELWSLSSRSYGCYLVRSWKQDTVCMQQGSLQCLGSISVPHRANLQPAPEATVAGCLAALWSITLLNKHNSLTTV